MSDHTTHHTDSHDAHHGAHHKETFISKYVFSMDHKMIAKQYLITGIIMAVVGMVLSILFRIQLGWPDESFPFLEKLLGKWAQGGRIDPSFYMSMVTIHGTIMVFFVLTAGLSGTFSKRHGIAIYQYAFLLVILFIKCNHGLVIVNRIWSCIRWVDNLSSIICTSKSNAWLWFRYDIMVNLDGTICCIGFNGWY
jgi:hypothetical protein